ncbi:Uncharacterised protein [Mycobacterium tuberculosis]|nr:Uncharacterised protein [Mycobacterium tuberculosis]COX06823.1 Uncharacterised protein [Mycobacterium tuberculosis]COZ26122.1 Uncharacterised protein [Mycobacterium tuberculosis]
MHTIRSTSSGPSPNVLKASSISSGSSMLRNSPRCPRYSSEKRWIASPTVGVYTTGISSGKWSASTLKYSTSWR